MNITLCPVHAVDQVWPKLRDGFQRAIDKTGGDVSILNLWQQARSGRAFLFLAHDAEEVRGASLWRTDQWPDGERFRCLALYGEDMDGWIQDMRAAVKQACGDVWIIADGRFGWPAPFPHVKKLRVLYEDRNP